MTDQAMPDNGAPTSAGLTRRRASGVLLGLASLPLAGRRARAATYPSRTVRLIVPYAAAGTADLIGRKMGQKLSEMWGQGVVIENRPSGGAVLGVNAVINSPPDGYTLLLPASTITLVSSAYRNPPYDIFKGLAPVTAVAETPYALIINKNLPVKTISDFIKLCKDKPGSIKLASAGVGTIQHLCVELLKSTAGVDVIHVPYKGVAAATTDIVAGEVDGLFDTISSVRAPVQSGNVRLLAVTGRKRVDTFADTPTMIESGAANFDVSIWFAIMVAAGTPADIVEKIRTDVQKTLTDKDLTDLFKLQELAVRTSDPEGLRQMMVTDVERWGALVRQANIHFD